MEKHAYLLGLASQADKSIVFSADQQTIYNMLSSNIPQRILAKTKNPKLSSACWVCGTSSTFYSNW